MRSSAAARPDRPPPIPRPLRARRVPIRTPTRLAWALGFLFVTAAAGATPPAGPYRHELTVRLVPGDQVLRGTDRISFRPRGATSLKVKLSPKARVGTATADGRGTNFSVRGGEVTVHLASEAGAGETTVTLTYQASFRDPVPQTFTSTEDPSYGVVGTITERGTFLDSAAGWYPDVTGAKQTFRIRVEAPEGTEAITQGRLAARGKDAAGTYSVWEVARPASGLSLCAGPYIVQQRDADGVPVFTYLYVRDADLAGPFLEKTAEYLSLYRRLFGPYPFEKFAVVENFFPTGYGFPSFTLLGEQLIRLPFILAESLGHEIAHSWWGNGVLVDYRQGNWSEGLTTYVSDYLYRERESPEEAREYRLNILRQYATLVPPGKDFPLKDFVSRDSPASRAIGYGKAAMVFHMVRRRIGDKAFWEGLRAVAKAKLFQRASWSDFADALGRSGGTDLRPFFRQWVERPGAPVLSLGDVHLRAEGSLWLASGTLYQARPFFDVHVPMAASADDGEVSTAIALLQGAKAAFALTTAKTPRELRVDPDADLFRRLDPSEVPPMVNSIRGAASVRVVVSGTLDAPTLQACRVLLEGLGLSRGPVVPEADEPSAAEAEGDVLFLGLPQREGSLPTLPEGLDLSPRGFSVQGKTYGDPGDALFVALPRSDASGGVVALFFPLSAEAALAAAPKVPHYGKYSYLAFRDGKNEAKGTWPVSESPTIYRFAQKVPPLSKRDEILDVANRQLTHLPDILGDLETARVVLVGELHDQKWHHWAQLQVIRALDEAGVPLAVGLEMIQHGYQWALDHWVAGDMPEEDFVRIFARNWDADYWPVYRDIFLYARQHGIPMVGLNLPRSISDRVAMEGFSTLDPEQMAQLPGVTSCDVGPEYRDFIKEALQDTGHEGLSFVHFCEAQLLWDTTMAENLLAYLEREPSRHAVVMAGSGHSWKKGIPAQIRRRSDVSLRVILPEVPGRLSPGRVTTQEADYLWLGLTSPGD